MSRGWIDTTEVEKSLERAYEILSKAQIEVMTDRDEAFIAIEEASGFVAEALARVQGDTGSFDNQEGV